MEYGSTVGLNFLEWLSSQHTSPTLACGFRFGLVVLCLVSCSIPEAFDDASTDLAAVPALDLAINEPKWLARVAGGEQGAEFLC